MDKILLGFVETTWFTKRLIHLLTDDEYSKLQSRLIEFPDAGTVIPGSGGIRKFRFAAKGKGTRGGARVIYYLAASKEQIFMLDIYSKDEKSDLKLSDLHVLKKLVEEFLKR